MMRRIANRNCRTASSFHLVPSYFPFRANQGHYKNADYAKQMKQLAILVRRPSPVFCYACMSGTRTDQFDFYGHHESVPPMVYGTAKIWHRLEKACFDVCFSNWIDTRRLGTSRDCDRMAAEGWIDEKSRTYVLINAAFRVKRCHWTSLSSR